MEIKTLEVAGIYSALFAMRNPLDSWEKSDTVMEPSDSVMGHVGKKDKELSMKLAKSGSEHAKHLRMCMVYANIKAPRYWWQEFDTYRAGVEKVSCSTMHTLMKRPLEEADFEADCYDGFLIENTVYELNREMEAYKLEDDPLLKKKIWRGIIQALPQSFLQMRTVMMSYAALRNMYRQREGHKLQEWHQFREWCKTLPESWMITDELPEDDAE